MLELGKKSEILHKNLSTVINNSDIDKVFVKGNKTLATYKKINKYKRGNILQQESDVDFALKKQVSAICTGPISKISLHKAGYTYPGHTEMLADLTNSKEVSLMLMTPILNVAHVTAHMGLIDAIENIDDGLVFRTIQRSKKLIQKIIKKEPAIGVCAINPHAGENKAFGRGEEEIKITPAIKKCLELGWNVKGPLAADALFYSASKGSFDLTLIFLLSRSKKDISFA